MHFDPSTAVEGQTGGLQQEELISQRYLGALRALSTLRLLCIYYCVCLLCVYYVCLCMSLWFFCVFFLSPNIGTYSKPHTFQFRLSLSAVMNILVWISDSGGLWIGLNHCHYG